MSSLAWADIERYTYKTSGSSGEYRFNCTFCSDTGYHLYVNKAKRVYHCFKCSAKGKLTLKQNDLYQLLDDYDKVTLDTPIYNTKDSKIIKSLPRCTSVNRVRKRDKDSYTILRSKANDYLMNVRGLTSNEVDKNNLKVTIDESGIYSNGIVFPVGTAKETEYFVVRRMSGDPKYVNAPWPKGGAMFKSKSYTRSPVPAIFICEGVFDAIRLARMGTSYALLGKEASIEQIRRLVGYSGQIVIALDPDAESYAMKLKLRLLSEGQSIGKKMKIMILNVPSSDPGELDREQLQEVRDNARLFFNS